MNPKNMEKRYTSFPQDDKVEDRDRCLSYLSNLSQAGIFPV
ncbi:MAG: hypothetical protein AAGG44_20415 [Planctomycetota bacterium]